MPRAKKTMSGNNPQKIEAIQGQTYGEGVRQENLQKVLPAPQSPEVTASSGEAPSQTPAEAPAARPQSFEQIAQQVRGAGNLLRQPDDRPDLPVTDGIASGPGRGPETLGRSTQLGNTLRRLALQTNDPIFTELATKAGL